MRLCLLAPLVLLLPVVCTAQDVVPLEGGSRIRSSDKRLMAILNDGARRSPTLRGLVDRVEGGDVVVYLESQPYIRRMLLGAVTWVGSNDQVRFVRVSIKMAPKSSSLIATLAHELRHVVEVIDAPWVNSNYALRDLYEQIGQRSGLADRAWDTRAAQLVTDQVMHELNNVAVAADDER